MENITYNRPNAKVERNKALYKDFVKYYERNGKVDKTGACYLAIQDLPKHGEKLISLGVAMKIIKSIEKKIERGEK